MQGLLAVQEKFGDKVETAYLESAPEGPHAGRALERLAREADDHLRHVLRLHGCGEQGRQALSGREIRARRFKQESDNVTLYNARFSL